MTQTISVESRTDRSTPIIALLLLSGITLDIQYGILAPLIGVIATESGLTGSEIGWVLNALMMGSVISVSLTARMGDIFGHRKVLIALIVLALVGMRPGCNRQRFLASGRGPIPHGPRGYDSAELGASASTGYRPANPAGLAGALDSDGSPHTARTYCRRPHRWIGFALGDRLLGDFRFVRGDAGPRPELT